MAITYNRNSNLISSKNLSFNKTAAPVYPGATSNNSNNKLSEKQSTLEKQIEILENQHKQILAQAEFDKQKILDDAKKLSLDIEKSAYEEGYSQGLKNGHEDGYKEAYEKGLQDATNEMESKLKEATDIFISSKSFVENLAISNKDEIIKLSIVIAEKVLAKELKDENSLDAIFENALLELKDKKSLVIKVNPLHKYSIENKVSKLKDELSLTDDIHIIGLSSINEGDALIETEKGTLSIGISVVLENIKAELL